MAVSDDRNEWLEPSSHLPEPRFTSCERCDEVDYRFAGHSGTVRIDPKPLLRIERRQIVESELQVRSPVFEPGRRYFQLWPSADEPLAGELTRLANEEPNEIVVVMHCSDVIYLRRLGPTWRRFVPAGYFAGE
jgi:hypothetical protein